MALPSTWCLAPGTKKERKDKMELKTILSSVDHTLLSVTASWEEIKALCDDGIRYKAASVCIPASYVKAAAEYACGRIPICTVIGFPNGYSTTAVKCFEAADAVKNGADEIDMVINVGWLKDKKYDLLLEEIKAVKASCSGKLLKVIIETCLLNEQEKIKMCEIVSESGADFIKTSTGFSAGGATREDVALFAKYVKPHVKIKAAGGIASLQDAEDFLRLGASRLGTSRIIKIVKSMDAEKR
jgi:deoxyribose-phosphate aldolase